MSRSATTVMSYLMAREGLSFEDALVDLISKRSCVGPNRGFCDQLRILQNRCDGQLERYCHSMFKVSVSPTDLLLIKSQHRTGWRTAGALIKGRVSSSCDDASSASGRH